MWEVTHSMTVVTTEATFGLRLTGFLAGFAPKRNFLLLAWILHFLAVWIPVIVL